MEYNKLSTDPFGRYLAVMITQTSFSILGDLDSAEGKDIGANIKVEKYNIDQITGIRFYGPNHFVVVGVNGIVLGFMITGNLDSSKLEGTPRFVKFLWKREIELQKDEVIDTYDVLQTGTPFGFLINF